MVIKILEFNVLKIYNKGVLQEKIILLKDFQGTQ